MAVGARRRHGLPQLGGAGLFVTDGGLETELIFHNGLDLPCFAAFPLLDNLDTRTGVRRYYDGYLAIAREHGAGFIIETPTWRANPDWASQLGYSPEQLDAVSRDAVALAEEVRRSRRQARRTAGPTVGCCRARRLLRHGRPTRGGDRLGVEGQLGSCG